MLWCFYFFNSPITTSHAGPQEAKSDWFLISDYLDSRPRAIAVMPMDNYSLEPGVEQFLYQAVYNRLSRKGYMRISADTVKSVAKRLGMQMQGQISAFSSKRLADELKCDALLMGSIDQSAHIHKGGYDAIVVTCSLRLMDLKTGKLIWRADQWRTAHRQWQIDPVNALINFAGHENESREKRVAFLVSRMLSTLPNGGIKPVTTNLLEQAIPIKAMEVKND